MPKLPKLSPAQMDFISQLFAIKKLPAKVQPAVGPSGKELRDSRLSGPELLDDALSGRRPLSKKPIKHSFSERDSQPKIKATPSETSDWIKRMREQFATDISKQAFLRVYRKG